MSNIIYESLFKQGFYWLRPYFINNDGVILEIYVNDRMKNIRLLFIKVLECKKGQGTKIMTFLTDLADKNGYTMTLTVDPSQGTPKKVLCEFYEKFGFKARDVDGNRYKRVPCNQIDSYEN